MIHKLTLYIITSILSSTLVVLLSLMSLDFIVQMIENIDYVGRNNYTFFKSLLVQTFLIPSRVTQFFPSALIIGVLLGLGKLQSTSELTVIQNSGMSKFRIGIIGILLSTALGLAILVISEFVGFSAQQYAERVKSQALGYASKNAFQTGGVWLVNNNNFVNIKGFKNNGEAKNISIFKYDQNMILTSIITAESAMTQSNPWILKDVDIQSDFIQEIKTTHKKEFEWKNTISVELIKLLVSDIEDLSSRELWKYIQYHKSNSLNASKYELIFWQRIILPLTAMVLCLIALPFVFGSHRSKGQGKKLFLGLVLGLVYYIFSYSTANIVLLTTVPVIYGALLPPTFFALVSMCILKIKQ